MWANDGLCLGLHLDFIGLYGIIEISCILGGTERRDLWKKAVSLFLPFLLRFRGHRGKCEVTAVHFSHFAVVLI
jgi:hypothetical protein